MVYSDNPLRPEDADTLDRDRMAKALAAVLGAETTETPLVVGIFGGWGTGKTSLMRRVEDRLVGGDPAPRRLGLWFDAWKFARQEQSLWRALILTLLEHLRQRAPSLIWDEDERAQASKQIETLEDSLYRSMALKEREGYAVRWGNALPLAADLALRWATAGASAGSDGQGPFARFLGLLKGEDAKEAMQLIEQRERERYVAEVTSMEQFRRAFENALGLFGIGAGERQRRLFVFVDDLDRCLPDDAVAALEAIKLFLDLPGCVFVLGMDREVVEPGIRARYKPFIEQDGAAFDPAAYLDKIIQIPFTLPPLGPPQLARYLDALEARDEQGIVRHTRDLIELVVPGNPRTLKRILNLLRLTAALAEDVSEDERERHRLLAKVLLLQSCYPSIYEAVASGEKDLAAIEAVATDRNVEPAKEPLFEGIVERDKLIELFSAESRFDALGDRTGQLLTLSRVVASGTAP